MCFETRIELPAPVRFACLFFFPQSFTFFLQKIVNGIRRHFLFRFGCCNVPREFRSELKLGSGTLTLNAGVCDWFEFEMHCPWLQLEITLLFPIRDPLPPALHCVYFCVRNHGKTTALNSAPILKWCDQIEKALCMSYQQPHTSGISLFCFLSTLLKK